MKKIVMSAFVAMVLVSGVSANVKQEEERKSIINKALLVNSGAPTIVTDQMKLFYLSSADNKSLHFQIEFFNTSKEAFDKEFLTREIFEHMLKKEEVRADCTIKGVREVLDAGVVVAQTFYSNDHYLLGSIKIQKSDCVL